MKHKNGGHHLLDITALILMASGVLHLWLWILSETPWEGALSFRKPALFGISTGLTALSLGWVLQAVQPRKFDSQVVAITALAFLAEVLLITLQTWRGVPSHFNHSTTFDTLVHWSMDACIVWITLSIFDLTIRVFRSHHVQPALAIALQQGMLLLDVSCLIGFVILWIGFQQQALGNSPTTYGQAGILKFPHGMVIHALQLLPVIAWATAETHRTQTWVKSASYGCWGLLLFSLMQTFSGRTRADITFITGLVLKVSLAAVVLPLGASIWSVMRRYSVLRNSV